MKAIGDRVKVISGGFSGEVGTVKLTFPARPGCPVDGYGVLLDSDDYPEEIPMYYNHYELEEIANG